MSLPLELVREIIHLLLFFPPPSRSTPDDIDCAVKPTWDTINALSLTTRSFRPLALEAWFRTLYIDSPENLIFLRDSGWFPELGSKWTKHLHCVQSFSKTISFWNLSTFLRVSSIDWTGSRGLSFHMRNWTHYPFYTSPPQLNTSTCADGCLTLR